MCEFCGSGDACGVCWRGERVRVWSLPGGRGELVGEGVVTGRAYSPPGSAERVRVEGDAGQWWKCWVGLVQVA